MCALMCARCVVSHGGIKAAIGNVVLLSKNCYDLPGQLFPLKGLPVTI